jgi:hypothetical protein
MTTIIGIIDYIPQSAQIYEKNIDRFRQITPKIPDIPDRTTGGN